MVNAEITGKKPIKVVHIITGLNTGGAEMVLYKLLSIIDQEIYASEVISLTDIGSIGEKIESLGIRVRSLGMRRGIPSPLAVAKLAVLLYRSKTDVIQTWMYHADLLGGLSAKLAGGIPVAWGIHHSNLDSDLTKRMTILTVRLLAWLSGWLPKKIVCCSEGARKVHERIGYMSEKMVVIKNGIDISTFKSDLVARKNIRRELGIPEETLIIGLIGRFDPQKDHRNFIEAAGLFQADYADVQFLLCGDNIDWMNKTLVDWIDEAGIRQCIRLLGRRDDIPQITATLDIATCSSFGESFSLTIGEAMACGISCVTTDIEAPVDLLGGYGWVVPIHDPQALRNAWREILRTPKKDITKRLVAASSRIRKYFSLETMRDDYQNLFKELHRDF